MRTVNIHQAKTNFLKLIEAVQHGEEIIIANAGKPAAKLVPITHKALKRKPGSLKSKIKIAADFDAPLANDILKDFEDK